MAKGRKTGGRVKGSLNKRTKEFLEILEEKDFCPARALIRTHRLAMKEYRRVDEIFDKVQDLASLQGDPHLARRALSIAGTAPTYLSIAQQAAKELMQYAHPKRKAIELTGKDGEDLETVQIVVGIPKNGSEAD